MKKLIAMLTAALMLLSLTACGAQVPDSTSAGTAISDSEAAVADPESAASQSAAADMNTDAAADYPADDTGIFEDSAGVAELPVGYMEDNENVSVGTVKIPAGGNMVAYGFNAGHEATVLANGDVVSDYMENSAEDGAVANSVYINTAKAEVYVDVISNGELTAEEMLEDLRADAFLLTELNAGTYGAAGSFTAESDGVSVYTIIMPLDDRYSISIRCTSTELYDSLGADELGIRLCNLFLPA